MIFYDFKLGCALAVAAEDPDYLPTVMTALRWRFVIYLTAAVLIAKSFDLPLETVSIWPLLMILRMYIALMITRKFLLVASLATVLRPVHPATLIVGFFGAIGCLIGLFALIGARTAPAEARAMSITVTGFVIVAAAALWEVFRTHPLVLQERRFKAMVGEAG
jgi:hypothetical protein